MNAIELVALVLHITTFFSSCKTYASGSADTKSNLRRKLDSSYFRLRLYWEKGYRWQGKSEEKFWCMQCNQSSCSKGSGVRIDKCDREDPRQQFYYDDGRIRSRENHSMCFERKGRSIELNSCNKSIYQKWNELSQKEAFQLRIPGNKVFCASQHHHPKEGEAVYMTSCKKSISNKTDKWIAY
ncbi:hypothetical protein ACHAWX_003865 [Stephanocyclus meneghinianus]